MKEDPVVFIKELSEQDRPFMLNHFLGLSPADRRLRFGAALPDEAVTKYVNAIDFDRDTIFGVYESTFNLVGVGHLAFPLPENLPPSDDVTAEPCRRIRGFRFRAHATEERRHQAVRPGGHSLPEQAYQYPVYPLPCLEPAHDLHCGKGGNGNS